MGLWSVIMWLKAFESALLLWFWCFDTGTNEDCSERHECAKERVFVSVCWMCAGWHFSGAGAFSPRWLIICSLSFKDWHSSPIFLWWALGGRRWRLSVITNTVLGPADKTPTSDWLCEIQISDLSVVWRHARRTRVLALTATGLLGPQLPVTHWLLSVIWKA